MPCTRTRRPLPACLAGERHGPPEDCGGVRRFYNLLEAVGNPRNEYHDELIEWLRRRLRSGGFLGRRHRPTAGATAATSKEGCRWQELRYIPPGNGPARPCAGCRQLTKWIVDRPSARLVTRGPDALTGLGAGETAAITLALELNADLLLMGERRGAKALAASGSK